MIFNLGKFPKFKIEYANDEYETWGESLRNNGYPSARVCDYDELVYYEMDDLEYTLFVLRWS